MDKKVGELFTKRVARFRERVAASILGAREPLATTYRHCPEQVPFEARTEGAYAPIEVGTVWGAKWESAWFHCCGRIPEHWRGQNVVARLDLGGEGLVFSPDGTPLQGLSNGSVFKHDFNRDLLPLFPACEGGEAVELWVEGASNGLFGLFSEPDPGVDHPNRFGSYNAQLGAVELAVFHEAVWHLWLDLRILAGFLLRLGEKTVRRARILHALGKAMDACRQLPGDAPRCRELLAEMLACPASASDLNVVAVGHAHIDTAWLWPVSETVRKCARTFASQLDLIDRYPDYVFGASQPQHFAFVEQHYPKLFEKIVAAVKAGRLEPQGGMWVEADCNLISGESMIRQILHGKNYFKDKFDVEVDHLWLPDVFGYSAAMPQILRKSGLHYFLTQKISWNQFNTFPHHTFKWRGIDGHEVLTHFPPENTYNSQLDTEYLLPAVENFAEKGFLDTFISLFGVGDGGGGPKAENIELGKRMVDLEGAPRVRFDTAASFFAGLSEHAEKLPTWVGELYLELHRGTLTSQAQVKKANRKAEFALRQLELLHACLPLETYPVAELDALWKLVLLNQFHDIIPGSSINAVYRVTHQEYARVETECRRLRQQAAAALFEVDEAAVVVFNSLSDGGDFVVALPASWAGSRVETNHGEVLAEQLEAGVPVISLRLPGGAFATLRQQPGPARGPSGPNVPEANVSEANAPEANVPVLENALVRYEFDEDGRLRSALHKSSGRALITPGKVGNALTLYGDFPNDWDAWDVDLFYENHVIDRARGRSMTRLAHGPVRKGLRFELTVGQSEIVQEVWLSATSTRLDFVTTVDWREKHRMLRVAFPTTIQAEQACFDIQYGYVRRNTHRNTSWDLARFEVCAHKYADLSDLDFGVALLNDCKYGYKVHDGVLDLNLLRSPNYPDPEADMGVHQFTYALLPHEGDLVHSDVLAQAAQLNQPPLLFAGFTAPRTSPPWRLEGQGLALEVVKKAEKQACLVVRIVETLGRHSRGRLHLEAGSYRVIATDLMEWEDGPTLSEKDGVALNLKPFEILTLKLLEHHSG